MDIISLYKDAYIAHFKKQGYSTFEAIKMAEKVLQNMKDVRQPIK
jgi:hypothetical protein